MNSIGLLLFVLALATVEIPRALAQPPWKQQIPGKFHPGGKISLSPNGRWLIAAGGSPGYDKLDAIVVDLQRRKIVDHLESAPFAWSPEGWGLYGTYKGDTCTGLELLEIPSLRRREFYHVRPHDYPIKAAFSADGKDFVISTYVGFSRYRRGQSQPVVHYEWFDNGGSASDSEISPDARMVSLKGMGEFRIVGTQNAQVAWKQQVRTGYSDFHGWDDEGTFAKSGVYTLTRLYYANRREGYTFFDARSHQVIGRAHVPHSSYQSQEDIFAAGRLWHWDSRKLQIFDVPSGHLTQSIPMTLQGSPAITTDGHTIYEVDNKGSLWQWKLP